MSIDGRSKLAAMQADLVAALVGAGTLPQGFDALRLGAAVAALATKRVRAVARAWPCLREYLAECFAAYAATSALPRRGGPLADGRAFAHWLQRRGPLPDAVRLQMLAVDLRYARHRHGLSPRRGPCLRLTTLPVSRRLVIALGLPLLGEHWFTFPWPGRAKFRCSRKRNRHFLELSWNSLRINW